MDHDRASGEGVGPMEYSLIKMKILDPLPEALRYNSSTFFSYSLKTSFLNYNFFIFRSLPKLPIYLVAATLRPETMYGQTNCWLRPDMDYIAFQNKSNEIFVCTYRAALNMSYQKMTAVVGKVVVLARIKGEVNYC